MGKYADRFYAAAFAVFAILLFTTLIGPESGPGLHLKAASSSAREVAPELPSRAAPEGLVNVNTADAEALQTLPEIGPHRAEAIIAFREENGPFQTILDLALVPGIGRGIIDQIKEKICLEESHENTNH